MVPLDRRLVIYTLLTAAFLLNSGLALYDNNLTGAPRKFIKDLIETGRDANPFDVGLINAGSSFSSSFVANVTLTRGSDAGYYRLDSNSVNSLYGDAYRQSIVGDFKLSYVSKTAPSISFAGSIDRTRLISLSEPASSKLDTIVTVDGPSGAIPGSKSSVELLDHAGTWSDMAWMGLLSLAGIVKGNESGETTFDVTLDEVGIAISDAPVRWTAKVKGDELRIELVSASNNLHVGASFVKGIPWPRSYELSCQGVYSSEEGPVSFQLGISSEMKGPYVLGSGDPIPWDRITREPSVAPSAIPSPVGAVVSEGGETYLRFTPQQALDKAKLESADLRAFLDEPGITFSGMSYYSNNTRVQEEVVWNVTLTSSRMTEAGHPSYAFTVAAPVVGGRLDLNRFTLIYEKALYRSFSAEEGRPIVSLEDNEVALSNCRLSNKFIFGSSYEGSYEMHILDRAAYGTSASSTLISNMLGMAGSRGSDVFINYAEDQRDHKTVYLAVIDGLTGNVASLVTLTGSLSPYGAGLA